MPISVALIAHDSKKDDIVALAQKYRSILSRYHLIATDDTGQRVETATGLTVERLAPGVQGGVLQIAARVVSRDVVGVVCLMDPLTPQPHEADCQALVRVCNLYDVPLATNVAIAELAIQGVAKRR